MHVDSLILTPGFQQTTRLVVEHAWHHAITGLDYGQIDSALDQRFENDAADETGTDQYDVGSRLRQLDDVA